MTTTRSGTPFDIERPTTAVPSFLLGLPGAEYIYSSPIEARIMKEQARIARVARRALLDIRELEGFAEINAVGDKRAFQLPWPVLERPRAELFAEAFPKVDPGFIPLGSRIMVQVRTPPTRTRGGIFLIDDSKDTERDLAQVGVVIALGTLAYCDRTTLMPWPEGAWVKIGDFVRIPRYGGDRVALPIDDRKDQPAIFVTINDHEVLSLITTGDPLTMKAYV